MGKHHYSLLIILTTLLVITACVNKTPSPTPLETIPPLTETVGVTTVAPTEAVATTVVSTPSPLKLLFRSNRGGDYNDLYVISLDGTNILRLTSGETSYEPCGWSPDGNKILFTGWGNTETYVGIMNADGTGLTDLTNDPDHSYACGSWSADGSQIVYSAYLNENNDIYAMSADGSWKKQLTNDPGSDSDPVWSPIGSLIAFVSDRGNTGNDSLYIMKDDGSELSRLTNDGGRDYSPAWSPDGTKIAYSMANGTNTDIWVIDVNTLAKVNLTNGLGDNSNPTWSPDGRQILFQTNRDGNWEIYIMYADGSIPVNLTNNPADDEIPFLKP